MRLREYHDHSITVSTGSKRIPRRYSKTGGTLRKKVELLLSIADVEINGARPWDLQVHNNKFYHRVLASGSLGLGESYVDGWWDCEALDEFFHKILRANLGPKVNKSWTEFIDSFKATLLNLQNPSRAFHVGQHHYDIGNDLYEKMLGRRLIYSCGYWQEATSLDEAQEAKLDLSCRKLAIEPGMRVLDIGCGWGDTARFIAARYKAEVIGITISKEQAREYLTAASFYDSLALEYLEVLIPDKPNLDALDAPLKKAEMKLIAGDFIAFEEDLKSARQYYNMLSMRRRR